MKAVMYYKPGVVKYEEVELSQVEPGEVLVKVEVALTCGTDIKTYKRGHPLLIKTVPSGFGHEFAGVIAKVGDSVKNFKVGQRVVAANSAPCQKCYFCKLGKYNLCEDLNFLNGAFAEYIKIPARIVEQNLLEIPENLSFEEAAFTEPFANVVYGANNVDIKEGTNVGVIGLGPIGLLFVRYAKLKGANVTAMGRNPLKLKLAKEFGKADKVVNLLDYEDPEVAVRELTPEGKGFDVTIEAVGLPHIWEKAIAITRKGGTVNLFGGCKSGTKITLDTRRIHYDEIQIKSTFHHTPKYVREALSLLASGQIDVKQLITHTLHISQIEKAIKLHDEGHALKIVLKP